MNLVIGATGSLGGHIAHRLLKSEKPVRALVREGSEYSALQSGGAQVALGDLKNTRSLQRACVGARRIIATATAAVRGGEDTADSVDRQGYSHLIAAAVEAGVRQFIFVSAHGFSADSPVDLVRAKVDTEEALKASGLNYTILRPALFMEAWISMILGSQLQLGPKVVVLGDPDQRLPFVCTSNVTDLAIAVLGNASAERTSLPLSSQAVSYRQVIEWMGQATDREIAIESVPPDTQLPGLPPTVLELWSWLATGTMEPIETVEVAVKFGLALESVQSFIDRTFGKTSST
jgi:uncharacterized protein YbjT (DUF2867 family)